LKGELSLPADAKGSFTAGAQTVPWSLLKALPEIHCLGAHQINAEKGTPYTIDHLPVSAKPHNILLFSLLMLCYSASLCSLGTACICFFPQNFFTGRDVSLLFVSLRHYGGMTLKLDWIYFLLFSIMHKSCSA